MKKYQEFLKESKQKVYLGDEQYGFEIDKYSRRGRGYDGRYRFSTKSLSGLNNKIKNYIEGVYGPFKYRYGINEDINVNGLILKSEYISKMVNNYTIFKRFIIDNKITDKETFYSEIVSNFHDIYHYDGDFFKRNSLPILINTTRKGNINEKKSIIRFEEVVREMGFNITVENPTVEEDIKGIDGKFSHKNIYYTIQIKPFSDLIVENEIYKAKSNGSLSLGVNYLILYKEDEHIILSNKKSNPINIDFNYFVYNKDNIIFSSI
jgi:hypothetical protein